MRSLQRRQKPNLDYTMAARSADITRQTAGLLLLYLEGRQTHPFVRDQHQFAHRCGRSGPGRRGHRHRIFGSHDLSALQILPNVSLIPLMSMTSFVLDERQEHCAEMSGGFDH